MTPEIYTLAKVGFSILFYLLVLFFVVFSVATVYHWFTYGSSKHISMISLAVYLIVCAPLFIVMTIALSLM